MLNWGETFEKQTATCLSIPSASRFEGGGEKCRGGAGARQNATKRPFDIGTHSSRADGPVARDSCLDE